MSGFRYEDIFATKHLEYLLVIAFLLMLMLFWRMLHRPAVNTSEAETEDTSTMIDDWFNLPDSLYYHQGHSWAAEQGGFIKVGIDDFAQKMMGHIEKVETPSIGSKVEQGKPAFRFKIDSATVDMLSPVRGEVIEVNREALDNPKVVNDDPYGRGWLFLVKPYDIRTDFKHLLTGRLARSWLDLSIGLIKRKMENGLGILYADGGTPVTGMGKMLFGERWNEELKKIFLTD
ncbi:MAG: glycine cleavage system protein H [Syntrophorhabdaceae bacterium]|nr:glycine cleavage system protein H [Syntrophorhabdaceae bacterium]